MEKLDLTDLDESATRKLTDAKERFKDARKEATRAFNNKALETSDRILAMQYRVMATILEKVDNPADALGTCRVCVEELYGLSAIQESFNVELAKGFRARFGKDERRKIICNVCHVNFVIYSVSLMVCFGNKELPNLPCIGSGEDKVDLLRDERLTEVLRKQGMEHCCVTPWSFGQEGEWKHKLKWPCGIATNPSGQFIIGDEADIVKVFDSSGTFTDLFSLRNRLSDDDIAKTTYVRDVATDTNDNIYLLVGLITDGWAVYEFNNATYLVNKFPVRGDECKKLTVTDIGKVLVLTNVVDVYKADGSFVFSFGREILKYAEDIAVANDRRVIVVDGGDSCVRIFSEHGDHLNNFKLQLLKFVYFTPVISFHRESEHIVVAGVEEGKHLLRVEIYTKDGGFVRSTQIHEEWIGPLRGVAVTTAGNIVVVCNHDPDMSDLPSKILVVWK